VLQPLTATVIVVTALLLAWWMSGQKAEPGPAAMVKRPPAVTVVEVSVADIPVQIEANGTVRARDVVTIVPQVEARIVAVHPSLRAGGFFAAADVLIELDPTDYEIELQQAEATIAQRMAALKEADAAISEFAIWKKDARLDAESLRSLFAENSTTQRELDKAELALERAGVQHEAAIARRDSADSGLRVARARAEAARVQLQRTRITLPYDGCVIRESAEVAQYVARGQTLAEVYRTDAMEVVLPLEDWQLAWFDVGDGNGGGATVAIETDFAGATRRWDGRIARLEGTVDQRSRMVRAVVDVNAPGDPDGDIRLIPGMFVTARIAGRTMQRVVALPRRAIRGDKTVWTVDGGTLHIMPVQVVRQERKRIFVRGLAEGDRVITSALDIVVEGMAVRTWSGMVEGSTPEKEMGGE